MLVTCGAPSTFHRPCRSGQIGGRQRIDARHEWCRASRLD
jgi:hypothetical protein